MCYNVVMKGGKEDILRWHQEMTTRRVVKVFNNNIYKDDECAMLNKIIQIIKEYTSEEGNVDKDLSGLLKVMAKNELISNQNLEEIKNLVDAYKIQNS